MATTRLDTELRWPGSMQESARALLHRTSNWTRARHSDHKFSNAPCKQAVDLRGLAGLVNLAEFLFVRLDGMFTLEALDL